MSISEGIDNFFRITNYVGWSTIDCLKSLAKNCTAVTSENREDIIAEFKYQLQLISIHSSINKKARDKAIKLYNNAERSFQFKEVIAFFDQMDKKANENLFETKTDLYGSEVAVRMIDTKLNSFRSPVSSQAMTLNGVNVDETAEVSEIVQASSSAQTNDKEDEEVDVDNDESEDDGEIFPNSSLFGRNDTKDDGTRTPPHQITVVSQSSANEINESILRGASENLTCLNDDVKYFKEFIPLFEEYKDCEKNNVYSCTNDDVMDIRGDGGFAKFLTTEEYTKLLSLRPKRSAVLPNCWHEVIKEYYKESLTEDGPKKTISDWVCITNALIVVNDEDTEEVTRLKKYLYRVMLPLIESFLKPIPDISASNSSEHHYWSEFGHRFFSYALQEFAGLDWRAMEVPILASKYRKNYELDHSVYKVVEGKCADLLAWSWETGEEIFVGEQAGPPTKPDLTKLSMDSFKLYRELRDCLNVRILNAMKIGDVSYANRAVFGILGYLFEVKMLIMWKDGVYIYEEFGSFTVASHSKNIHMMKSGILKLLEFIMVIKTELKYTAEIENDNDKAQILKRKFSDFIQTKPTPIKVTKVKK